MTDTDKIVGSAKEAAGKVEKTVGEAVGAEDWKREGALGEAEGASQRTYGEAKDGIRSAARQAREFVDDVYERGDDYVRSGRHAVGRRVEEGPIVAVLIAGAIGFALGMLVSRRD